MCNHAHMCCAPLKDVPLCGCDFLIQGEGEASKSMCSGDKKHSKTAWANGSKFS